MNKEFDYRKLSNSELYYCIQVLGAVIGADTHNTAVHLRTLLLKEKDLRKIMEMDKTNTVYKLEEPTDLVAKFDDT